MVQMNLKLLKPPNVCEVYTQTQGGLAGGGSFAPHSGPIARQSLAMCVSRTTCLAISTNLSSGWFYQDHRSQWFWV